MKISGIILLPVLLVFCTCNLNEKSTVQEPVSKTVFIIVDGIPPNVIEEVETPAIDAIVREGGYARAYVGGEKGGYSESPTISAVGYNNLLTGTWANKHNVWGNEIKQPNYHYWSLFRLIEEVAPDKKTAIFSTWLDNRTKLIGEGKTATDKLSLDYHFDGFEHDTVNFPHDDQSYYIHKIDEHVAAEAARYIRTKGPDLSWVYLQYTDNMGHTYGDSPQYYEAVRQVDGQIQYIWNAIQKRMDKFNEKWLIVVTTDHGRDKETGKGHGGQSSRERAIWIATNASGLNNYFKSKTPGIVDIYPTICRFMDIEVPTRQRRELDGIPLIGPVSILNLQTTYNKQDQTIDLQWDVLNPEGKLDILVTRTDNFKTGGTDQYQLKKTVSVDDKSVTIDVHESPFYKIVLEAPFNTVNRWEMIE